MSRVSISSPNPVLGADDKAGIAAEGAHVACIDIAAERGSWYKEIGQGMGAALNTADEGSDKGDKKKGDKNGDGIGGVWHIVSE